LGAGIPAAFKHGFTDEYLKAKMLVTKKTPAELINGMIHREMALAESC
jgi:hypothetical protein